MTAIKHTVTDDALEGATRRLVSDELVLCHRHNTASDDDAGHLSCPICFNCARLHARAALDAAAPLIAAQALRDFAASMDSKEWGHRDDWGVNCAYSFEVLAHADQIEGEQR